MRVLKYLIGASFLLSLGSLKAADKQGTRSLQKTIETKESIVDIQGKKFRKIEVQKETFFVETLDSTKGNEEIRVLCQQGQHEVLPAQVTMGAKVSSRASVVIEGMRQACKEAEGGRREVSIDPAVLVGLQLDLNKDRTKKVIVSPLGITFKADW